MKMDKYDFMLSVAYHPAVESSWIEEREEYPYWVSLKDGFYWEMPGQHLFSERTRRDVIKSMRLVSMGCTCWECKLTESKLEAKRLESAK